MIINNNNNNNNCQKSKSKIGTKEAYVWTYIGIGFAILFWLIFTGYVAYYLVQLDNLTIDIVETTPMYKYGL